MIIYHVFDIDALRGKKKKQFHSALIKRQSISVFFRILMRLLGVMKSEVQKEGFCL